MIPVLILFLSLLLPLPDGTLLESGKAANIRKQPGTPTEIKVVTYNVRWRSGQDLKNIITALQEDPEVGNAAIIALQEVDRNKKRSGSHNTAKQVAEELGLHYAWAAPPSPKPTDEEQTGVALMSIYPLSDVQRIVLPHEGPGHRRRVALGATIEIEDRKWRVYSAHSETRIAVSKKLEQFKALLDDLARFPADMPAIIMGDLNTWEPSADDKTVKFFTGAGWKTPFGGEATFKRRVLMFPLELKLDWVWLRGLEATSHGVDRKIEISDHWPLWTNVKFR